MPRISPSVNLFERMTRLDALDDAWAKVRSNGGCAGGDGVSIKMFQPRSSKELILLSSAMRGGRYRPGPFRLLNIPKKKGGTRPLAVPSIIDRVAQAACAATLSPVFEPHFNDTSFGYRPGRGVRDAVFAVTEWRKKGYEWVVEADIVRCFERIPHEPLVARVEAALDGAKDAEAVVDLIAMWLDHAGDALGTPGIGLAQGSPLSPLLSNLYLDGLDDELERPGLRLVRYADDFVILCMTEKKAEKALDLAGDILDAHGLELKSRKTRVVDFDRGFEFLGHMFVRSFALKQVADSEEDVIETLRGVAAEDAAGAAERKKSEKTEADLLAKGYDPGTKTLYVLSRERRLGLANQSFAVRTPGEDGDTALLLSVPHQRVDRVEIGPGVDADMEAIRHALATDTDIAFVDGRGLTLGALAGVAPGRAKLHLAQARLALDEGLRAGLARRLVEARLRNQRAVLKRLNRNRKLADANDAALVIGRLLRKLARATKADAIMGYEGAGGAVYWPAYALLTEAPEVEHPFRRDRPANDPLDAALNYVTALLGRDVRCAVLRVGLHPGFGALHTARDHGEACVWDLVEPFRGVLCESVVASEFNNRRIGAPDFARISGGGVRISGTARRRLVEAFETAAARLTTSPYGGKRRRWRALVEDAARAYGQHCAAPDDPAAGFVAPILDY